MDALCINSVRGLPWVDGVVVGMDNLEQLRSNISVFSGPSLPVETVTTLRNEKPYLLPKTLDPAQWTKAP